MAGLAVATYDEEAAAIDPKEVLVEAEEAMRVANTCPSLEDLTRRALDTALHFLGSLIASHSSGHWDYEEEPESEADLSLTPQEEQMALASALVALRKVVACQELKKSTRRSLRSTAELLEMHVERPPLRSVEAVS